MARLAYWGLSMYGGYYAQIIVDDRNVGLHSETLRGLREQLKAYGITKLMQWRRFDN